MVQRKISFEQEFYKDFLDQIYLQLMPSYRNMNAEGQKIWMDTLSLCSTFYTDTYGFWVGVIKSDCYTKSSYLRTFCTNFIFMVC